MTTYLEVLNHILSAEGIAPVSQPDSPLPKAVRARVILDRVLKEFQVRDWWFNTEYSLTLTPNLDNEIVLPANTLECDPTDINSKYVVRGTRLYDSENHTFTIESAVEVDLVVQLEVEDLPEVAATYLKAYCAREQLINNDGDLQKIGLFDKAVARAWAFLQQSDLKNSDVNARKRPMSQRLRSGMIQQTRVNNGTFIGGG